MLHRIINVKALPCTLVWVEFRDGGERIYDIKMLVDKYVPFRELVHNHELFFSVKKDVGGYGISWNDDLDLSAEEIWENGFHLKESITLERGSNCPTCGQKIRKVSQAQIAASMANLAKRTQKGGRPINPNSKRQKKLAEQKQVSVSE